jgi:hypothetical protein
MPSRKPVRVELVAQPDQNIVFFGCRPWTPEADQVSMGVQDARGLWRRGKQRKRRACPRCGGEPGRTAYCEGCAAAGPAFKGPEVIRGADANAREDNRPRAAVEKEAVGLPATRREKRRILFAHIARVM